MGFYSDRSGNVAIMTGIMVFILLIIGGASVDFIRATSLKSELQSVMDGAVLAAANPASTSSNAEDIATEYFNINFDPAKYNLTDVDINLSIQTQETFSGLRVTGSVDTALPTHFIKLLTVFGATGLETLDISTRSAAGFNRSNLEISLVLDISGSMLDDGKIDLLRDAGSEFVENILEDGDSSISINLIPFAGNVNLGDLFDDHADPADYTAPAAKPCLFYLASDFDDQPIAGTREIVDQDDIFDNDNVDECALAPIQLNSSNEIALSNAISSFAPVHGSNTDSHIGMLWGLKALSPALAGTVGGDFADRPVAYNDSDTTKIIIMMSDGDVKATENVEGVDSHQDAEVLGLAMCDEAKDNNILVFTIGFDITTGSDADEFLENCASNTSQYFFVEGLDLEAAFNSIAITVDNLRLQE